jgi:REP element-mobilizing transposase RayT
MKERNSFLTPGGFYHIYNRANGDEVMFRDDRNYEYFLKKYSLLINPIARTCAYCLMPNHFHFLVQIRSEIEIIKNMHNSKIMQKLFEGSPENYNIALSRILTLQFSHLFNSYAQAYNKLYSRKGSLFMRNYKRIKIKDDPYFIQLAVYIHLNPVNSKLVKDLDEWKHSSYKSFLQKEPSLISTDLTLDFFNDLDNFIFVHQKTLQGL